MKEFGKKIAKAQDELNRNDELLDEVRRSFLEQITSEPEKQTRPRWVAGLAIAAVLTLIVTGYVIYSATEKLEVNLGDEQAPLPLGQWVVAPPMSSLPLHFSDGSKVVLEPGTRARVEELHSFGARLLLEKGSARVAVKKGNKTNWVVDVGPFEIVVIGTEFDVGWDPNDLAFSLELIEGNVLVTGAMISPGEKIKAGQTLVAWIKEDRYEVRSSQIGLARGGHSIKREDENKSSIPVKSEEVNIGEQDTPGGASLPSQRETIDQGLKTLNIDSWHVLARRGIYDEAMEAAKNQGLKNIIANSSASKLLLLGDTARLTGDRAIADRVYRTVRGRFAGTSSAGKAAFALGRMAFDQQGSYDESARWLKIYLKEQGGTPLAREALGRLMEACELGGDTDGARLAATKYLAAYPDGPHALKAKNLAETNEIPTVNQ